MVTMVNLCLPWFNYSNHVFILVLIVVKNIVNFRKGGLDILMELNLNM